MADSVDGMAIPEDKMEYRRLGDTGVKVSVLSFGSWVTFDNQLDVDLALECMQAAHDAGCNFFDNAEAYAGGKSESIMGRALRELGWPRWSYMVTTKLFWGIHGADPNMRNTLNRKYLMQAIDGSLERFGLDFVDVVYCHRADPDTPMEETVWAMSEMVSQGKALYWGTSEWTADEIRHAIEIAERHHLHKPVPEQSQHNLVERPAVAEEHAGLVEDRAAGEARWEAGVGLDPPAPGVTGLSPEAGDGRRRHGDGLRRLAGVWAVPGGRMPEDAQGAARARQRSLAEAGGDTLEAPLGE